LGDSFTAGYRVGNEHSFSYLIEKWINANYGKSEVLISTIEEPVTGLYYLDRFGLKYHPHIILLGLTLGNDLMQTYVNLDPHGEYILKVGQSDVSITQNPVSPKTTFFSLGGYIFPPEYHRQLTNLDNLTAWGERWLKKSPLFSLILHREKAIASGIVVPVERLQIFDLVNGLGMFTKPLLPEIEEAYRRTGKILAAYKTYCDRRNIIFGVMIFPQRYQVQPMDWQRALAEYNLEESHFDLRSPNKWIGAFCRAHNIPYLDPTDAMAVRYLKTKVNMYLPQGDMHWNKEGHRAFFESIQHGLLRLIEAELKTVKSRDAS